MFLQVPGEVEMTTNGKNKALESKICVLGSAGVGKSGKIRLISVSVFPLLSMLLKCCFCCMYCRISCLYWRVSESQIQL